MRASLTRTDCLALSVAQAIVVRHLGLEGTHFAQAIDLKGSGKDRVVEIRTPEFHQNPSQKFVIRVDFTSDEEYEYKAELHLNGSLLKKFWWNFCGSKITLMENPE